MAEDRDMSMDPIEDVFLGGADYIQKEEGGKRYVPGERVPGLTNAQRVSLQAAGLRFGTIHHEPVVTPEGEPAQMAAAGQIPEGAVVAAVEAMPAADEKPRRAARERE
jgi:hypothetical protein